MSLPAFFLNPRPHPVFLAAIVGDSNPWTVLWWNENPRFGLWIEDRVDYVLRPSIGLTIHDGFAALLGERVFRSPPWRLRLWLDNDARTAVDHLHPSGSGCEPSNSKQAAPHAVSRGLERCIVVRLELG